MFSTATPFFVFFSSKPFELSGGLGNGPTPQVKRAFAMSKNTRLCTAAYFSVDKFMGEISLEDAIVWLNTPRMGPFVAESARQ